MNKRKVPLPKADPRGYENLQGSPMNVNDHPTYNLGSDPHEAPEAFRGAISGFGPKTLYSIETNQMNNAVGVQSKVRDQLNEP